MPAIVLAMQLEDENQTASVDFQLRKCLGSIRTHALEYFWYTIFVRNNHCGRAYSAVDLNYTQVGEVSG